MHQPSHFLSGSVRPTIAGSVLALGMVACLAGMVLPTPSYGDGSPAPDRSSPLDKAAVDTAAARSEQETTFFAHVDPGFMGHSYWDDGQAEIHRYDAELRIYGQARTAEHLDHIVVSERHLPGPLVKADDWRTPGTVDMLKFNYVTSAQTGVYRYQQMLSFFFDRSDQRLAKMTLASHEWCGNTFKELVHFRGRSSYEFNTYWEGQGNGSFEVDFPADMVVYDSLPVQLRALRFAEGLEVSLALLPRQLSSKASEPLAERATLSVTGRRSVEVPAGRIDAWILELRHGAGVDTLAFEAEFPHRMLSWTRADGDRFALRTSQKLDYWNRNRVRDESLLE